MSKSDLRLQQRAKLLAQRVNKPTVTLTKARSLEASKKSIELVAKSYAEEAFEVVK
ncbi:hypothetical protein ACOLNO_004566 [Vibrio parahaemolyticus]|uniref:hypothetical protein n=1 Tax=Vibrio parahaemolyticus TaxID=670 RepID=UPI0015DFD80A|nr:hypothetical protein [Vibrio parahaemolyticus]EJB5271259.1 hypothetical protein [Vibrio vulnificus]EGQ8101622.1 hypothetical protein [Vibrio parahaemolyticus]EGQ8453546.1 hypothetical protein [Vibrio parahaemolyticus]EHR0248068.1 hypothetical protein [Vibrio parahaemolyticus]EID4382244.1 hypothetical protein [Vibrio parahaemolyticus]